MIWIKNILFLSASLMLFSCTTTSAQKGDKGEQKFEDDLTSFRPVYTLEKDEVEEISGDTVVPAHHVNVAAQNYLDSLRPASDLRVKGYRIQIYTGNSGEKANDMRAASLGLYPDWCVYKDFTVSFSVKVGDFKDRLEAHEAFMRLRKHFPRALLVNDYINLECHNE